MRRGTGGPGQQGEVIATLKKGWGMLERWLSGSTSTGREQDRVLN